MVTGEHGGFVKYWQHNMNNVKMYQAHKDAVRGIRLVHRGVHSALPYVTFGECGPQKGELGDTWTCVDPVELTWEICVRYMMQGLSIKYDYILFIMNCAGNIYRNSQSVSIIINHSDVSFLFSNKLAAVCLPLFIMLDNFNKIDCMVLVPLIPIIAYV